MSPRRKAVPDAVQQAISDLEALKARRTTNDEAPDAPPERPPGPKKRGRPPKTPPAQVSAPPTFGVSTLTAHQPLALLEVQDPSDLDALMADPRLASLIALRLDPRFALATPATLERLQAALLKAGHTPRVQAHR